MYIDADLVDADTCSVNGIVLVRRPPPLTSNPSIGIYSRVSDAGGRAGAFPAGLRQ